MPDSFSDDPLADPVFAAQVAGRVLQAADHPWEIEQPPDWNPIDAVDRFLRLVQTVNEIVGQECEADLWPGIRSATFFGEIVLPVSVLTPDSSAVIRVSKFLDLVAVLNDDSAVLPDVMAKLNRRFARQYYKQVPSIALMKPYDGHHRGTKLFRLWRDRLFGYL